MAGAGYKLFTAGAVLTAAQMNTFVNEQTVMVFATSAARDAALTSVKSEGNVSYQLDANSLTVYSGAAWSTIGPIHGALTTWTPVVVQGATPTLTNVHSVYTRIGRLVWAQFLVTITSAGTAANDVSISLPVNCTGSANSDEIGFGYLRDVSAPQWYQGFFQAGGASTFKIQSSSTTPLTYLGSTSFTLALASGDQISGNLTYEAAADA